MFLIKKNRNARSRFPLLNIPYLITVFENGKIMHQKNNFIKHPLYDAKLNALFTDNKILID